jgi:hypothetical protein
MRSTVWVLMALVGLAASAAEGQAGCTNCKGKLPPGLDAEACAAPGGFCLEPGCCEESRRCCDNAWAGYCDHRARVDAFWSRVGVPGSHGRGRACRWAVTTPCSMCEQAPADLQPLPAVNSPTPAPSPAPPKAGRRGYTPPLR